MEFHLLSHFSTEAASILSLFVFFCCLLKWKKSKATNKYPPKPSGSWPIIGHLHLLGELPHISLGKLADKYGPIIKVKLGVRETLVVSSPSMAKEFLGTNDRVFVDRHDTLFVKHSTYKTAMMGFSPYGPYWREMRKISTVELLSNQRVEMLKHTRIYEVRAAMKAIHASSHWVNKEGVSVDMKQWFNDISLNSTIRLVASKSLKVSYQGDEYNQISKAFRDFFELAGAFVPADAFPFLRWLDIGGYEKAMKKLFKEIDHVAQVWLDEHKSKRISKEVTEKPDFLDALLGKFDEGLNKPYGFDTDTIIKATVLQMILAGSDTTAVTLTWALTLLVNNKDIMRKAQAELDTYIGKERQLNDSDLKNLVYLDAILMETMRLYPAGPLSVPRVAVEDCSVNGYHIPAGSQLLVNLYKIHRDPEAWEDPLIFYPERFLTSHKDCDVRGNNFEFIPFGSGRRICPGISFALQFMQFALANLLHGFDISTPSDELVDMTEKFGLTVAKATPLEVILKPRLAAHLYNM